MGTLSRRGQTASGDEERRRAVDPAADSAQGGVHLLRQVRAEALEVEAERPRVGDQRRRVQMLLVLEEQVVHAPERALGAGRLSSVCCLEWMRMDLAQREIAKGEPEILTEHAQDLLHAWCAAPEYGHS